jgi:hypothetical protein
LDMVGTFKNGVDLGGAPGAAFGRNALRAALIGPSGVSV